MKVGDPVVFVGDANISSFYAEARGAKGRIERLEDMDDPSAACVWVLFDQPVRLTDGRISAQWGCCPAELQVLSVFEQLGDIEPD